MTFVDCHDGFTVHDGDNMVARVVTKCPDHSKPVTEYSDLKKDECHVHSVGGPLTVALLVLILARLSK